MSDANTTETRLNPFERSVSLLEFGVGAAIVVAHNVFRAVPNEVPILFVVGVLSVWLRNGGLNRVGFGAPESWFTTLLWAVAAVVAMFASSEFLTVPLGACLWGTPTDAGSQGDIKGNLSNALAFLSLAWTFAAIGEETGYRAYLLNRAAEVGGRSRFAYFSALVMVSVLFGVGHWYQGPAGVLETGVHGFLLGAAYLLSGRNMWTAVLAHGIYDTVAVALVFAGLAT